MPTMNVRMTCGFYSLFGTGSRAEVTRHMGYRRDAAGKKVIDSVFFSSPVGVNPAMGKTKCWLAKTEGGDYGLLFGVVVQNEDQ